MLRANFHKLIRTTLGYSLSTLVGPIFTLLLTPLYARMLGVENYGVVGTLSPLTTLLFVLALLSMNAVLPVFYYDPQLQGQESQVVSSGLSVTLLWATLLTLGVMVAAEPITRLAVGEQLRDDMPNLVRVIAFGTPFSVLYSVQTTVLRLRFAVWRANLLALLYMVCTAASNLILVVMLDWQAAGVIWAGMFTNVAMGLASLLVAHSSITTRPSLALMRMLGRHGFAMAPATLAVWVLAYGNRLLLPRNVGYEQIGIYDIANRLASALALLVEPFKSAWGPLALSIQSQESAPRTYSKGLTYFCVIGLGIALALSLFAHEALLIITTAAFIESERYVWLLALTPLVGGFTTITVIGLQIEKKLGQVAWLTATSAILNMVLSLALIPWLGILGAALASALSYVALALLSAFWAQRVHPFPYEWRKILLVFGVYVGLAVAGVALGSQVDVVSIALRLGLWLAFPLLLLLLRVFDLWEVQLFRRVLAQPSQLLRWLRRDG